MLIYLVLDPVLHLWKKLRTKIESCSQKVQILIGKLDINQIITFINV